MDENNNTRNCVNCGNTLVQQKGAWVCVKCNPRAIDTSNIFVDEIESEEYTFIECPGATLYKENSNDVDEGVRWIDDQDATKGFEIIGQQIYAPNHKKRRRIRKEALGKIRRCRACQDYTIRMRRPEGRDFFIPSYKHPRRKKLRSMEHVTYEPN